MATNALNWVLWPACVCFCTGIIFKTSFWRDPLQEKVNDLRFSDGQRKETDLLQGLDIHVLDPAAQLGEGDPLLILGLASTGPLPQQTPTTAGISVLDAVAKSSTEAEVASHSRARPPAPGLWGLWNPPTALASSATGGKKKSEFS